MRTTHPRLIVLFMLLLAGLMSGCTIHYVADYDASVKDETLQIAKKVDLFWGKLLDTPAAQRPYSQFQAQYTEIETDIRGLLMKNQVRPLNDISTKQVSNLLELWIEDRDMHKKDDNFSDFLAQRHRKQFVRVFTAIAKGEDAKQ